MTIITGFDCETTGLEFKDGDRMVEVCFQLYNLETRKLLMNTFTRLNPMRPIQPKAQAVHHISLSDVQGCPQFKDLAPKIAGIARITDIWVAHNGIEFDMPFLETELKMAGFNLPHQRCLDTMVQGRWATPTGKIPNLGELCFACDVPYSVEEGKAHAADYDVNVMMECFWKGRDWGFFSLDGLLPMKVAA